MPVPAHRAWAFGQSVTRAARRNRADRPLPGCGAAPRSPV